MLAIEPALYVQFCGIAWSHRVAKPRETFGGAFVEVVSHVRAKTHTLSSVQPETKLIPPHYLTRP